MGRLVEPAMATAEDLGQGVPPGKAVMWVKDRHGNNLSGFLVYDSADQALQDMAFQVLKFKAREAVVNYKVLDESLLIVWHLERTDLPRQEPIDWGKLWRRVWPWSKSSPSS